MRLFISYSRKDAEVANEIVNRLGQKGFEVLIDTRDLPFGEEFKPELEELIKRSDTVLWLLSEYSISSRWCQWELNEVVQNSKRLIPIRIGKIDENGLPDAIGKINILPPLEIYENAKHLDILVKAIETDYQWIKSYTRLMELAAEWKFHKKKAGFLKGKQLKKAEDWILQKPVKAPSPHVDVVELIQSSRKTASSRLRYWIIGSVMVAAIFFGIAVFAFIQQKVAELNATNFEAGNNARTSQNFYKNLDLFTNWNSEGLRYIFAPNFKEPLQLLSTAGNSYVKDKVESPIIVKQAMRQAILEIPPWNGVLEHSDSVEGLAIERSGNRLASITNDKMLYIWDLNSKERKVFSLEEYLSLDYHSHVNITWCGETLVLIGNGLFFDIESEEVKIVLNNKIMWNIAKCSSNSKWLATQNLNGSLQLYSTTEFNTIGAEIFLENSTGGAIEYVSWNTEGDKVVFASKNQCYLTSVEQWPRYEIMKGRFLGWSQDVDYIAMREDEGLSTYLIEKSLNPIKVEKIEKLRLWNDALSLTHRELEEAIDINLDGDDIYHKGVLSPDMEFVFLLNGECYMGNAGGGCNNISIEVYDGSAWIKNKIQYSYADDSTQRLKGELVNTFYGHIAPPTDLVWLPSGKTFISASGSMSGMSFLGHDFDKSALIFSVEDSRFYPRKWGYGNLLPLSENSNLASVNKSDSPDYPNRVKWSDQDNITVNFTEYLFGAMKYAFDEELSFNFNLSNGEWYQPSEKFNDSIFVNEKTTDPKNKQVLVWENKGSYVNASGDEDIRVFTNLVKIFNKELTDSIVLDHPGFVPQARWSPKGDRVLTTCFDGFARIFDAENGELLDIISVPTNRESGKMHLDFADWSPDGKWVTLNGQGYGVAILPTDLELLNQKINQLLNDAPPQGTTREQYYKSLKEEKY